MNRVACGNNSKKHDRTILKVLHIFILASLNSISCGQCHNRCSGHGECNNFGQCECWDGYEGWDCSSLECPFGAAWSDLAAGTDNAHNHAVCSNMGYCDGETGICTCHEGFEGRACERALCPSDCSGHGQCLSMAEAAAGNDGYHLTRVASYDVWDAYKIFGCICDEGFEGYDCSLRPCPKSDSALTLGQQDESVVLYCRCGNDCTETFRLRYKGQYATITPFMSEDEIADKLMGLSTIKSNAKEYTSLPISVTFSGSETNVCSAAGTSATISFVKDPGDLPPVYIKFNKLTSTDGAEVYMTTKGTLVCACGGECGGYFRFVGDGGEATEKLSYSAGGVLIQAALSDLSNLASANIVVDVLGGGDEACQDSSTVITSITVDLDYGNYPFKVVGSIYDGGQQGGEITLTTNDGTKEQEYCAGLGTCDFKTGQCTCDEDYNYDKDYGPCGQYIIDHSHWMGRQMCPGFVLRPTLNILSSQKNDWQLYLADAGLNVTKNDTEDTTYDSTILSPGFYWFNQEKESTDDRVLFANASITTTNISNAIALDMTYRVLYYGQGNKVMRVSVPSDLSEEELYAAANDTASSPVEEFVTLADGAVPGYLEMDLRPDQRYLYWTVPGDESEPDGQVLRKRLSIGSDPTFYEDLSDSIRSGMEMLGYSLTDPLGIALDLLEKKIYFADAQVQGASGGEDGIIVRCELDGTGVEIAADNFSDPRALVLDAIHGVMYITDTHVPSLVRSGMRNFTGQPVSTILRGVMQERMGDLGVESYYQSLINPQALQLDTRVDDLDLLYFSDYGTGYIYTVKTDGTEAETFFIMGKPKSFIFDLGEGYPMFTLYYDCHGHGVCSGPPYFFCSCDDGWEGNCAQKSCPQGPAWFDEATTDGSAHAYVECSARGHCARDTGVCLCHDGFTGNACQRMTCPGDCNGNGKCLSMRQLGLLGLDVDLVPSPASYGSIPGNPLTWDADTVYGCYCDWMGYQGGGPSYTNLSDWTGYDCSRKTCPTGDDSKAASFNVAEFEKQSITCTLTGGLSSGEVASFSFSFRQGTTSLMEQTSSLLDLEQALEKLVTIGDVEVTMTGEESSSSTATLCNLGSINPAFVLFKTELGDLPLLSVVTSYGADLEVIEVTRGTKVDAECSRHGNCDHDKGECVCFEGWASSDGSGGIGQRRDCGWYPGEAGLVEAV